MTQNQGVRQKWVCLKIMQKHTRMMMSENYVDKKTYIYIYVMIHKLAIN